MDVVEVVIAIRCAGKSCGQIFYRCPADLSRTYDAPEVDVARNVAPVEDSERIACIVVPVLGSVSTTCGSPKRDDTKIARSIFAWRAVRVALSASLSQLLGNN